MIPRFPDSKDDMLSLATWLNEQGYFSDIDEVISFFEKPWKYQNEWEMYRCSRRIKDNLDRLGLDHVFRIDGFDLDDSEICIAIPKELRQEYSTIRGVWWVNALKLLWWLDAQSVCAPGKLVDQLNFFCGRSFAQMHCGVVA